MRLRCARVSTESMYAVYVLPQPLLPVEEHSQSLDVINSKMPEKNRPEWHCAVYNCACRSAVRCSCKRSRLQKVHRKHTVIKNLKGWRISEFNTYPQSRIPVCCIRRYKTEQPAHHNLRRMTRYNNWTKTCLFQPETTQNKFEELSHLVKGTKEQNYKNI